MISQAFHLHIYIQEVIQHWMHEGLGMRLSLSSDLSAIHLHEISSHDQEMFTLSGIPSVEWVARYKIILTLRCCCCLGGDESGDGPAYMVRKVKNLHLLGSYTHIINPL